MKSAAVWRLLVANSFLVSLCVVFLVARAEPAHAAGRCSGAAGNVEQRIAAFWQCVSTLGPSDSLLAEDLGAWAQNIIDRDRTACIGGADFRASTREMQAALDSASVGIEPSPPKSPDVETRIAQFWQRVDALGAAGSLAATDVGQWGLNVIDRDPSRRIRVDDFQRSTARMQAAFDRARAGATICTPVSTPSSSPVATPIPTSRSTPSPSAPLLTPSPTVAPGSGNQNPWGYDFSFGSLIFSPSPTFCQYFVCIRSFWNGRGYVIQCADGMFSLSGGIQGSCSFHGGNFRPLYAHTVAVATPAPPLGTPSAASRYLTKSIGSGHYVLLDDSSLWKVDSIDQINAELWSYFNNIVVVSDGSCLDYHLINTDQTEGACASYVGQAGKHQVAAVSRDGQFVKLENGDVWQVDALDRFDTALWLIFDRINVVADSDCLYGYQLVNTDEGEIACAQ